MAETLGVVLAINRTIFALIGIPGNLLILIIYWSKVSFGSARIFIQALALTDLIFCLLFPLEVHHLLTERAYQSTVTCKIYLSSTFWALYTSLFLVVAVAWDRYLAVARPVRGKWKRKQATYLCFTIYLASVILAAPLAVVGHVEKIAVESDSVTVSSLSRFNSTENVIITQVCSTTNIAWLFPVPQYVCFVVSFVLILILYVKLILILRKRKRERNKVFVVPSHTPTTSNMANAGGKVFKLKADGERPVNDVGSLKATLRPPTQESVHPARNPGTRFLQPQREGNSDTTDSGRVSFTKEANYDVKVQLHSSNAKFENGQTPLGGQPSGNRSNNFISRISKMLLLATGIYFLTWFTTSMTYAIPQGPIGSIKPGWHTVISLLQYSIIVNHSLNPFLYGFINPAFRKECKKTLYEIISKFRRT